MNSEEIFYDVSVPYRGATFLNSFICYFRNFSVDCFRPLSGSYISQCELAALNGKGVNMFPSPIGELHFSIVIEKLKSTCIFLFPSPIGELHFSISFTRSYCRLSGRFPSPIGELHFSMNRIRALKILNWSFRPLSGSYISQSGFENFKLGGK